MSVLKETSKFENHSSCEDAMYLPTFPEPIDGEISSEDFLAAARQLVKMLDVFGKIFMPVKHDMQGNIDKLTKKFNLNKEKHSTLQGMIEAEKNEKDTIIATDALLWLRRGLNMIQLFFEFVVTDFRTGKGTEDLVATLKKCYEMTLEPYHGYVAQQLFGLLARMIPTRTQILSAIANGYDVKQELVIRSMDKFSKRLKENVENLKSFYEENGLESNNRV